MFRKLLMAASVVGAIAAFSQAAQAEVNSYLGGHTKGFCDDPYYCGGPGYYVPPPPPPFYHQPRNVYLYDDQQDDSYDEGLSCGEARRLIRQRGYRDIVARDCTGGTYSFFATRRGQPYKINVNAYRGRIVSIRPI
jgi:hypothetical protein